MKKKIPRVAETTFAKLAAEAGITCNPASEDERGWDFFLQVSPSTQPGVPFDMARSPEKCLVQIKSNFGKFSGIRLKVSNALEFSITDTACFVVLFSYSEDGEFKNVRVLHFWRDEIERSLKRVREIELENKKEFQQVTIQFAASAMQETAPDKLISYILSIIKQQGPSYEQSKADLRKGIGYDDVFLKGTLSFSEGVNFDDIIDTQIGIKDHLDVSSVTARSFRFGLLAGGSLIPPGEGRVHMKSHPKPCTVVISSEKAGLEVVVPGNAFGPSVPGLSVEQLKIRIEMEFGELIFTAKTKKLDFKTTVNSDDKRDFDRLLSAIKLIEITSSGTIDFTVKADGMHLFSGHGETEISYIGNVAPTLRAFTQFIVSNTESVERPQGVQISIVDLADRIDGIEDFLSLATEGSLSGNATIEWSGSPYVGDGKALYSVALELPGCVAYAIIRRQLTLHVEDEGRTSIKLGRIDYVRVRIVDGVVANSSEHIKREIDAKARQIGHETVLTLSTPYICTGAHDGSEREIRVSGDDIDGSPFTILRNTPGID